LLASFAHGGITQTNFRRFFHANTPGGGGSASEFFDDQSATTLPQQPSPADAAVL